jgi:hypothetical protein
LRIPVSWYIIPDLASFPVWQKKGTGAPGMYGCGGLVHQKISFGGATMGNN